MEAKRGCHNWRPGFAPASAACHPRGLSTRGIVGWDGDMGFLHQLQLKMERAYLERSHARERRRGVGREWEAWAAEHGFEYRENGPDLVGRWILPLEKGVEAYRYVLSGTVRGVDFVAFVYEGVWNSSPKSESYDEIRDAYLLAKLPRAPSRQVLERGAEKTIADFGIHLRDNYRAEFFGSEWLVLRRPGFHDPRRLAQHADLLARMIIEAPPALWSEA